MHVGMLVGTKQLWHVLLA